MTLEELQARIKELTEASEARELTEDEYAEYETLLRDADAKRDAAVKAAELRSKAQAYIAPVNHVGAHVGAPKEDRTQVRALESYIRTGTKNADLETRALSEGLGSNGGYTVPVEFQNKIVQRLKAFGGISSAAHEITTDHGRPMIWNTVDDVNNVGEIINEGDTFASGADITYGANALDVYQYTVGGIGSTPLRINRVLVEDSGIDIVSHVASLLAERIYRIQAQHFATGNGVGQPKGLVHGLTGIELLDDTKGIQYDDLMNWIYSVNSAYRSGAVWVLPDQVVKRIKLIKDSHGDPVFRSATADLATGTGGDTILGFPVVVDDSLPDITVNSNTINFGAFGRLSGEDGGYIVRRVLSDVEIEVDFSRRRDFKQVEVFAWARAGATQQNTNAYVALTGEA